MAENLLIYTKVDNAPPNDRLTVTKAKCVVDGMLRTDAVKLHDDKGGGHFGATWEHHLTVTMHSADEGALGVCWAVANTVEGGRVDWYSNNSEAVSLFVYATPSSLYGIGCNEHEIGSSDAWFGPEGTGIALDTPYYIVVVRTGETSWEARIYSDAWHTDLLDTLTLVLPAGRRYRHVFAVNSNHTAAGAGAISYDVENLDLNEAAGTTYDVSAGVASDGLVADAGAESWRVIDGVAGVASDGIVADRGLVGRAVFGAGANAEVSASGGMGSLGELLGLASDGMLADRLALGALEIGALASDGIVADRAAVGNRVYDRGAQGPAAVSATAAALQSLVCAAQGDATATISASALGDLIAAALASAVATPTAATIRIMHALASDGLVADRSAGTIKIMHGAAEAGLVASAPAASLATFMASGLAPAALAAATSTLQTMVAHGRGAAKVAVSAASLGELLAAAQAAVAANGQPVGTPIYPCEAGAATEGGLENFLVNYAEVDPNDHITPSADQVDFDAWRNELAYMHRDMGAGHFADFVHEFQFKITWRQTYGLACIYCLANDLDNFYMLSAGRKTALGLYLYGTGTSCYLRDCSDYTSDEHYVATSLALDTTYYVRVTRSGTSCVAQMFTDAARTVQIGADAEITLPVGATFRFVMPCNSYNTAAAYRLSAQIADLNLGEGGSMALAAGGSAAAKHLSGAIARSYLDAGVSASTLAELFAAAQISGAVAGSPSALAELSAQGSAQAATGGLAAAVKAYIALSQSDAAVAISAASLANLLAAASGPAAASIGAAALAELLACARAASKAASGPAATPTFPTDAAVQLDASAAAAALRVLVTAAAAEALADAEAAGLLTAGAEAAVETTVTISAASAGELLGLANAATWAGDSAQTTATLRVTATSPAQVAASVAASATIRALVRSGLALSIVVMSDVTDESCEIIILAVGGKVITIT